MTIVFDPATSNECIGSCEIFVGRISAVLYGDWAAIQPDSPSSFDTARQIGAVYSLFAGEDLRTLLNGFVDQVKAMSVLFAAAGGLIEAQDEAVAAALGKASEAPAGLQSLGLMGSIGATTSMLEAADGTRPSGGYDRVGPEDVSASPLERMVSGAQALDPGQFAAVQERVTTAAGTLRSAAQDLHRGLGDVLGSEWQGQFARQATVSVDGLTRSAFELADSLDAVAGKADRAYEGLSVTRTRIGEQASEVQAKELATPGFGHSYGPPRPDEAAQIAAARQAAEAQARAVINTEYSPAVMDANLTDLDFPTAYRVVSAPALGQSSNGDLAGIWNVDGAVRTATASTPTEAALAAATGPTGTRLVGPANTGLGGPTGLAAGSAPTDAQTQQALLTTRTGHLDGATAGGPGASATGLGHVGAGTTSPGVGGVNAATTAAATPPPPVATPAGGLSPTAAGPRGAAAQSRNADRGYGTTSGIVGGGGAAAAGAGAASRMGGAGTLAGVGTPGTPGAPPTLTNTPGPGAATAAGGTGSATSSSPSGAAPRGGVPMGMMGAAGATGQQNQREGHRPASYLVNATNTNAILGDPVKVAPAVLGAKPPLPSTDMPEPTQASAPPSPAQALVKRLTSR